MPTHHCDTLVITCIDYRFLKQINHWTDKNFREKEFDHVALAGGVYDFYTILKQVEISDTLHTIKKVVLVNHEDCGAYGKEDSFLRHKTDLEDAERKIEALFPHLDVETYFLHLDGRFEQLSKTKSRL